MGTADLNPEAVEGMRGQLGGQVLLPNDDGYDGARRIWNGMIDKRPALIVRPAGVPTCGEPSPSRGSMTCPSRSRGAATTSPATPSARAG